MLKLFKWTLIIGLALLFAGVAGYLVFTAPLWLLGAKPEDMILWGWITGFAAMIASGLVGVGTVKGLSLLFPA